MVERTKPIVDVDDRGDKTYRHPSYGVIKFSRISGFTELFHSATKHQHFVSLRIKRAILSDHSGYERVYGREELIEVYMTESQFARAISSLNSANAVPCTIQHILRERVEQPEGEDKRKSHVDMIQEKLDGKLRAMSELGDQIAAWRREKKRPTLAELEELGKQIHRIAGHFESDMPFYAQIFEEHMETVLNDAKTEIEAHMMATAGRLGIQGESPEMLEDELARANFCDDFTIGGIPRDCDFRNKDEMDE